MDAISDPDVEEVVVKSSVQVGKTLIIKAIIGFHIHQDPAPILVLQPTLEMAETFSKDRLAPMVRDTPVLRGRIADPRSRDSGNTLLHKRFPGGHITLAGANSAASLASRPIRIVLCDEVDRYPPSAGTEGDPVNLAKKRTATFWNRVVALFSTPTQKGMSRIDAAFDQSDQRRYFVPCPHCGHEHVLAWEQVSYPEGQPDVAVMLCPECGVAYTDADKPRMLSRGKWKPTAEFNGIAGFAINELYSPWRTFGQVARDYELAKKSPELLKTFINTSLGEVYEDKGEAPDWQRLYDKREAYESNKVPAGVAFLTAGVDVQADRLEVDIVGWAKGKQSFQVDYRTILGDTSVAGQGAWLELARMINIEQWPSEAGSPMPLRMVAIDSGYRTSIVYEFCRRFPITRVAPVKGRDDLHFVISKPTAVDHRRDGKAVKGTKIYHVGSSVIKTELYGWLRLDRSEDGLAPAGYCHFNQDRDQQYFKELTSEQVMTKLVKGFPRNYWVKTPGVRNEPLDCRVYARAAAAIAGMDRMRDPEWEAMARGALRPMAPAVEAQLTLPIAIPIEAAPPKPAPGQVVTATDRADDQPPTASAPPEKAKRKRRPSGFWGGGGSFW